MDESVLTLDRQHILEKTAGLWGALKGRRVFITGGTGFVGTWLLEAFSCANREHGLRSEAVVLTRNMARFASRAPRLASDAAISFLEGNAIDFDFPDGDFDYVIHAATERAFEATRSEPLSILDRDFAATRRVLDFCASRDIDRMLFTSSGAVYGAAASSESSVTESFYGAPDPTEARAVYGESKRLSEFACASYARAFSFTAVVARLFSFVGPYLPLDEGYAIGNFIADALADRPIMIAGDGTPRRSYLYAADLAIWLWTLLLRGESGVAYNVGSANAVSIRELAEHVVNAIAPNAVIQLASAPVQGAAPSGYVPAVDRACNLGLEAWIRLPEALRRTFNFYATMRRTTANI